MIVITGPADAINRAKEKVQEIVDEWEAKHQKDDGRKARGAKPNSNDEEQFKMPLPTNKVGGIIGPKGETMR